MAEFTKLKLGITTIYMTKATIEIHLEAYFVNNHPAMGNDTREPMGSPINRAPNSASESCKYALKSGIRVAQVAKFIPQIKNKIPILKRAFLI
jgi:hypothetical protein